MAKQPDDTRSAALAWPLNFDLSRPCEVFGDTIGRLTLREPTAGELVKHGVFDDQLGGDQMLDLIAELSGQTPAAIRKLPGADMLRLSKRVLGFFL